MTQEELIKEIQQLPLDQRREILDAVKRTIRELTEPPKDRTSIVSHLRGIAKPDGPSSQTVENLGENKLTISQRLSGSLKFEGGAPTDEEVKDMIAEYLLEKYS